MAENRLIAAVVAPVVVALYTCERGGEPMIPRAALEAVAGIGIAGDRYALGRGFWSYHAPFVDHVTFVESEAVALVREALGRPFAAADTRRNVVTFGIALGDLVGVRFCIGDAEFVGNRPCDPCGYLDELLDAPVCALLKGRGGLRASIVRSGVVRAGAPIVRARANATV